MRIPEVGLFSELPWLVDYMGGFLSRLPYVDMRKWSGVALSVYMSEDRETTMDCYLIGKEAKNAADLETLRL
jgi:hypothetical protein